jgi:ribosomal protein L35
MLPDLVNALKQVITDNHTTPAQRLQAADMLMTLWGRCLRDEDRKQKHAINRHQLKVKKTKVEADDRKTKLVIAAERRRIDETLRKAQLEIEGR